MNANELMIGDWVYAIDDNGEKHPCRVNDLKYDYINKSGDFCVDFYGTEYDPDWPDVIFNVEPIPLTPEILEKNEFIKGEQISDTPPYYMDEDGNIYYGYKKDGKTLFWGWWQPDNVYLIPANAMGWLTIKFVHELQHALRLCGIEKEIEL